MTRPAEARRLTPQINDQYRTAEGGCWWAARRLARKLCQNHGMRNKHLFGAEPGFSLADEGGGGLGWLEWFVWYGTARYVLVQYLWMCGSCSRSSYIAACSVQICECAVLRCDADAPLIPHHSLGEFAPFLLLSHNHYFDSKPLPIESLLLRQTRPD